MHNRYLALLALAMLAAAVFFGVQWFRGSCYNGFGSIDAATTTRAEAALFFQKAASLYNDQRDDAMRIAPMRRPLKAEVSGRIATLWVSGPMYAGDFRYAQLWQQVYQRYHAGSRCVHLRLVWKKGGIVQQFPPDTL
jgi:hypothetical protein